MAAKYEDKSIGRASSEPPRGDEPRVPHGIDRDALGDTLPPQPLKELLSAGGANLFVLSADAELIDTVQRAGGEQYPIFPIHHWNELEAAIYAGRCGIVLLDAELVGAKLVERITALVAHASRVVTLVAADRGTAQELMGYLSDRRIHRLLIKPATLGITKLLVESAVNRCLQLRELAAGYDAPETSMRAAKRPRARGWGRLALGAFIVVGAVAGALWLWRPSLLEYHAPEPSQAAAKSGERNVSEANERFADLLTRGAQAFDAGRLDNALDYYLTILSIEPGEVTARARLAAVVDALFAQAESALLANSLEDAATALASVRRADAASSRLAFLEAQLERATAASAGPKPVSAREAPAPAQPVPGTPAPTELDSLLVIATARLTRGQLLDPAGDSASEYLRRATSLNRSDARVVRARAALAAALIDAARAALAKNDVDDAKRLLGAAKDFGVSAETFGAVEAEVAGVERSASEHRHGEWLALASVRLRAGALVAPPGDSALDYLRKVQAEAPNFAGLNEAWDEWIAAQSARVRQAVATRSWATGETALAALATAPRGAAAAAPLRDQLEIERQQAQYLATASPAGELNLIAAPPAVYPPDALRMNVQGWVDVEFVVDRAGQPTNITVVAAEPKSRFDQAALAAVARYRYAPFERGGHVYDRRVRLRIRFALN